MIHLGFEPRKNGLLRAQVPRACRTALGLFAMYTHLGLTRSLKLLLSVLVICPGFDAMHQRLTSGVVGIIRGPSTSRFS